MSSVNKMFISLNKPLIHVNGLNSFGILSKVVIKIGCCLSVFIIVVLVSIAKSSLDEFTLLIMQLKRSSTF